MTDVSTTCAEVIFKSLKMTSAQVVETSVTNNSSSQNYSHPDDHTIRAIESLAVNKKNLQIQKGNLKHV